MSHRKAIIAIADGLGDRPIPQFGGLTPLQKAHTPNLDKVAAQGITGMMDLIGPGIPVGTDMGHLILFGGEISEYMGRGPIEAAGIDMAIESGDIIFRCNFATIDDKGIVIDRRAGRINELTNELANAVNKMDLGNNITAYFKPATEHRAVLILRGENLSEHITDSDPKLPQEGLRYQKIEAKVDCDKARRTRDALNTFLEKSHQILKQHPINLERQAKGLLPANFILTRGPGQYKAIASVTERYGIKACCIAGETTVLGVANLLGIEPITHPSFSANAGSNFALKAEMTLKAIKDHDVVFVHIKATDLAGHDNLPENKVAAIEAFDKLVGKILADLPESTYIALAADHSTPCEVKEHTGEPVPIAVYGPSIRVDHVQQYNEIVCSQGGLNRLSGKNYLYTILDYIEFSQKQGS